MRDVYHRLFAVLTVALSLSALDISAADAQPAQGQKAWKRFTADNGGSWRVEWSDAGDQAKSLRGRSRPLAADPETVAATFLSTNADVLGIQADLGDVHVASKRESLDAHHVTYQQSYNGLPVFNGFVDVHLKPSGEVFLVHNDTLTAGKLAPLGRKANLSPADAVWLAQSAHFNTPVYDKRGNPRPPASTDVTDGPHLGIQKTKAGGRLAYQVTVGHVRYVVDATSGEVLEAVSWKQSAVGSGRVFDPNPVFTLNDGTLRDQSNKNYAELNKAYQTKPLPGITSTGTGANLRYRLQGPHVHLVDLSAATGATCLTGESEVRLPPPLSPTGTFSFNRGHAGFEHTMAYYHIDRSQRYIQSLGFNNLLNTAIRVDAHAVTDDNSFYCGRPIGAGYLLFGDGGVDDAEDADVVIHEYAHALQDAASIGRYLALGQTGAMGEGFGDYWAFSQRGAGTWGPCFAEWDAEGTCLRRVDRDKKYPDDYVNQVHRDGEIWSRGLRDLARKLGKNVANKIILKSHFLIATNPTFSTGLTALLDADEALFPDDSHKDDICAIFLARGIRSDDCGYWITMRWDNLGADLDLHFRNPAGSECDYRTPNPEWGDPLSSDDNPQLYRDCIGGCTLEQINVDALTTPGTYRVFAHYYSDHGRGASDITIEVFSGTRRIFNGTRTLSGTGETWFAHDIVVSADAKPQIVEVDRVLSAPKGLILAPKK